MPPKRVIMIPKKKIIEAKPKAKPKAKAVAVAKPKAIKLKIVNSSPAEIQARKVAKANPNVIIRFKHKLLKISERHERDIFYRFDREVKKNTVSHRLEFLRSNEFGDLLKNNGGGGMMNISFNMPNTLEKALKDGKDGRKYSIVDVEPHFKGDHTDENYKIQSLVPRYPSDNKNILESELKDYLEMYYAANIEKTRKIVKEYNRKYSIANDFIIPNKTGKGVSEIHIKMITRVELEPGFNSTRDSRFIVTIIQSRITNQAEFDKLGRVSLLVPEPENIKDLKTLGKGIEFV